MSRMAMIATDTDRAWCPLEVIWVGVDARNPKILIMLQLADLMWRYQLGQ